jgi:hypothetical protein
MSFQEAFSLLGYFFDTILSWAKVNPIKSVIISVIIVTLCIYYQSIIIPKKSDN